MDLTYDHRQIAKHSIESFQIEAVLISPLSEWFELETQSHRGNDRYMVIGFDGLANLLEIGIEETSTDSYHVFHAIKATTHKEKVFNSRKHKELNNGKRSTSRLKD